MRITGTDKNQMMLQSLATASLKYGELAKELEDEVYDFQESRSKAGNSKEFYSRLETRNLISIIIKRIDELRKVGDEVMEITTNYVKPIIEDLEKRKNFLKNIHTSFKLILDTESSSDDKKMLDLLARATPQGSTIH